MIPNAAHGYAAATAIARDPRATEREAFRRATAALIAARGGPIHAIAEAVHANRRLWAVLGAAVADDGNELPPDLRARLLSLALFVGTAGSRALRDGDVEPLIDVNRALMDGLRPSADQAA